MDRGDFGDDHESTAARAGLIFGVKEILEDRGILKIFYEGKGQ